MKSKLLCIFVFMFVLSFATLKAQEDEVIVLQYGDRIEGVLEQGESEAEFRFSGSAGDIIVIEVINEDILNGLQPEVQLLNDRGSTLAETSDINDGLENFDALKSKITIELPADGDYTILVMDGPFKGAQGNANFVLHLLQPPILEAGEVVTGDASSSDNVYYIVISSDPFTVRYEKVGGSFFPAMNIDRIENGHLERLSTLYGMSLESGVVTVTPNRNTLHLVTLTRSPFDMDMFSQTASEFSLELVEEDN